MRIARISTPGFCVIATVLLGLFRLHEPSYAQDPAANVSTGKVIYEQHCLKCHGQAGRGDGPQAQWQMVRPTNFRTPASQSKSDDQLLSIIEHGLIFSPMHAWGDRLSPAEEQDVLAYIRLLAE
jgi:mono/diheme cytochrome c family protein